MRLETVDGIGLLAYAGLGATPRGTQPSEWMSAVLRGHGGLTFEQALSVLATAATKELPRHLVRTPGGAHSIIVPAFVNGVGSRIYSIDHLVDRRTRRHWYRYTSHQRTAEPGSPSARLAVGGTGGFYLAHKGRGWQRALLRLVKAHDHGKVSHQLIADQLAKLNLEAHQKVRDGTVGPRCIVLWCRRRDAPGGGGGGQFSYTGIEPDQDSVAIPTIGNGMDVRAIGEVFLATALAQIARQGFGPGIPFSFDVGEMDRLLADLPSEPDEKLR